MMRCEIDGTDYGPGGLAQLRSIAVTGSGPGAVGDGQLGFKTPSPISPLRRVKLYDWTGGEVTDAFPGWAGWTMREDTARLPGTHTVGYVEHVVDDQVLLKRLVGKAGEADAIVVPAGTLQDQIEYIVSALTTGSDLSLDTSGVDAFGGSLETVTYRGKSLGFMLMDRRKALAATSFAYNPAFWIGPSRTFPRASFGDPVLYCINQNAPPTPAYTLTDADVPEEGERPFGQSTPPVRSRDATDYYDKQEAILKRDGNVLYAADGTAHDLNPCPYSADGYWWAEPVADSTSADATEQEDAQNVRVARAAVFRETITGTIYGSPAPQSGETAYVILVDQGVGTEEDDIYQVAGARYSWLANGKALQTDLTLGRWARQLWSS